MWWIVFSVALLALGGAFWRWGTRAFAVCFLALLLILQASSALYLLPLDYYKDGGDGAIALHWVWIVHAFVCTAAIFASVCIAKRMYGSIFR